MRVGAYPGTFDPPTVAHLAIIDAALAQGRLERLDLVLSRDPLGKRPTGPTLEDRVAVLAEVAARRPGSLNVVVTDKRLIADVAAGYDAVVLGADKWLQVCDPIWYEGSEATRDAAVSALPQLLIVPRPGHDVGVLPSGAVLLEVASTHGEVSSTLVRAGRWEWMAAAAAAFDERTGAWSNPDRYRQSHSD